VLIELWTKEQFAEWERFARLVLFAKPTPDPLTTALAVDHPVLAAIQFKACLVEKVSAWDQDEEGLWSCTISLVEFRARKPATASRPLAAIPNVIKVAAGCRGRGRPNDPDALGSVQHDGGRHTSERPETLAPKPCLLCHTFRFKLEPNI
jgi:hypothetical protein